jgi:hypothetical protein
MLSTYFDTLFYGVLEKNIDVYLFYNSSIVLFQLFKSYQCPFFNR